jgi:putative aldouronate transport system permease protein
MINNGVTNVGDNQILDEPLKYATIIVSTVPILLVYPFLQKYFVKGALIGSVKG